MTCCESLQAKFVQARSDVEKRVSDLEVKVKFAEARGVEIWGILEVCLFNR
jgi:hypothetical protein